MTTKLKWIGVALLLFLVIFFLPIKKPQLFSFASENEIIARNEEIIDSLQTIIDANNVKQLEFDSQISSLNDSIIELQYIIKRREYTISNIKKQTNETLNRVSQFNSSDILQWGTERYKDSLTTK